MAYIEVHQPLITHRKLKALARDLHVRRSYAVGHLVCLWTWALDNAPDGDLTDIDPQDIREAADWPKGVDVLLSAMKNRGWLCSLQCHHEYRGDDLRLHDWEDYTGKLIGARAANTQRMRDARAVLRAAHVQGLRAAHVQGRSGIAERSLAKPDAAEHSSVAADDNPTLTRCCQAYDGMMGSMACTQATLEVMRDWLEAEAGSAYDLAEWFESACRKAALANKRSLGYVMGILKSEAEKGRDVPRSSQNGTTTTDPERAEYLAAKSRGTNTGAGIVVFTMSDEATIARYEAKQREVPA